MSRKLDLKGQKFGKLLALESTSKNNRTAWRCKCSCGKILTVTTNNLRRGETRSCGCLALQIRTKHGYSGHVLYQTWRGMHYRCYNAKDSSFKYYGKKGIKVCARWHDISKFIEDMYPSYKPGLTLERIDSNGDYCKSNCRWASYYEQNRNRSISSSLQSQVDHVSFKKSDKRWSVSYRFVNQENAENFAEAVKALYRKYNDKPRTT